MRKINSVVLRTVVERLKKHMDEISGTFYFLFSGGVQSGLVLAGLASLPMEYWKRAIIVHVVLEGNTAKANIEASEKVFNDLFSGNGVVVDVEFPPKDELIYVVKEYARNDNVFPVMVRVHSKGRLGSFADHVEKYGFVRNRHLRWCYSEFKQKVFRSLPAFHRINGRRCRVIVTGMSMYDSNYRRYSVAEFRLVDNHGICFLQVNPLYDVDRYNIMVAASKIPQLKPLIDLYNTFGDSANCVVCPLRSKNKQKMVFTAIYKHGEREIVDNIVNAICRRWMQTGVRRSVEEEIVSSWSEVTGESFCD